MIVSGFMRARRPLANTDGPFVLTVTALFVAELLNACWLVLPVAGACGARYRVRGV